ncbi:uncharacterized protein TrAFT101_006196 [Trichoderma asperellum]|uniref:uncharacterized protein n=1 Tax=Trichoderma asperellum TaxID=101201 RepID=UPI00331A0BE7|nr:hypothetical protein TrAFT101_006196 [Trichoderma asperellum]
MNWVEGNLSRHRRGKGWKEDIVKQEQYFAKARSRQREQAKTSPVTLSAANFVPSYSASSKTATGVTRSSPSSSLPAPLDTSDKSSANKANPSQIMQRDVTEQLLCVVPPSQMSGSAMFTGQSMEGHLAGIFDLEAERWRLLKDEDFMPTELPKLSIIKPTQKRGCSTAARQIVGQQQQFEKPTSRRAMQPSVGGQRGSRKRRSSQITSSPVDTTIRIRVGSRNYQWSEAGNSVRDPAYHSDYSSPSQSEDETGCKTSSTGNPSYVIGKSLARLSSLAISSLPWLSPGSNQSTHCRRFSDPTQRIDRAASAKSQCPMTAYTNGLSPRPPASTPAIDSVSSMVVEVGSGQNSPKICIGEEEIWRAWLNKDIPVFQVPKYNKT